MNYLAHLYLSGNNKNIMIGNFIADYVKGSDYKNYSYEIQRGILLHRKIDQYADTHPIFRKSMHRLHERYRHYDGVIIDILYDHFLAKNWMNYSKVPLVKYADNVYSILQQNSDKLPKKLQTILPKIIQYNWLVGYASIEGMRMVLIGMNNRTKGVSKMDLAIDDLIENYKELENDFTSYFVELEEFSRKKMEKLLGF